MPKARDSDASFKKTETISGHPEVTKHNINDEYFKNPPHNTDPGTGIERDLGFNPKESTGSVAPVDAELGRVTKEAELAGIVQEDSVHS